MKRFAESWRFFFYLLNWRSEIPSCLACLIVACSFTFLNQLDQVYRHVRDLRTSLLLLVSLFHSVAQIFFPSFELKGR